ncbi:hypothetical protein XA68_15914 [Ophiocordyceps unilateralis]|uniref:Uncharacterized protein n=1 Tax=Ophiocordyceps unilateralis TaxID=268505 RepID=A0A2A9PKK7_OPHUN|nr:hypothetical protein XA68_15914 [Ophiocordyceps unilateralis]
MSTESGQGCFLAISKNGITVLTLKEGNRDVSTKSQSLRANAWACVSVFGHEPSPTSTAERSVSINKACSEPVADMKENTVE